ncbi:MAG: DUF5615 family PIN-like protein, partial [Balneolales bacterium]
MPKRLSDFLATKQVDSRHTLELPGKNATSDQEIIRFAEQEKRIVITKDSDFLDNYIFKGQPDVCDVSALNSQYYSMP